MGLWLSGHHLTPGFLLLVPKMGVGGLSGCQGSKRWRYQRPPSPAPGPSWGRQLRGEEINFRNKTVVRI